MNIDDVLRDFATTGNTLPRASMRWALDHWDAAAPRFLDLLDRYADGADPGNEAADALMHVAEL
jgi:hypothetical protein